MPMTVNEARQIGASKLRIGPDLFKKCFEVAKQMDGMKAEHLGPMTLALGVLGYAKATKAEDLGGELTDALSLVAKAEREWTMEMKTEGRSI